MSLLAPLFLVGALAIAVPFWLHRLQTQSSERRPFSSAMLLQTTERRVHVRKKLKYLVLLALRVALLALIAFAFAKPLWTSPESLPGPGPEGTHVILIDTSASMSREGVFDAALDLARAAIDAVPGGAMLQVIAASNTVREVTPVSADRGSHATALQTVEPDATRLDFGQAMTAIDRLAEFLPGPVTLHFISDLQDSGLPTRFSDLVSSRIAALETHVPLTGPYRNGSIQALRPTATGFDVVVHAGGDDERSVTLTVNGVDVGTLSASGAGAATLSFTGFDLDVGDNRIRADLAGSDDLVIDDSRYHVVRREPPAPIPLLTMNAGGLPVTYLSAALHSDPASNWRVEPAIIGQFDVRTLSRYRWLIVDDVGSVGPELEAALIEFVENGGGLLAFAGQRSASATRIPVLGNAIGGASVGRVSERFLSVGQVDTAHPLLSGTDGWYAVRLSRSLPVEATLDDDVLIRLENDEPFLVERRIGRGHVLLVTGGLENQWNDLPVRPVFVTFAVEAARYLSGAEQLQRLFATGDALPLSIVGGASGQVIDPDGENVLSLADTTRAQRIQLHKTGFYEVYTSQGGYTVAVNVDNRESELSAMAAETLQRWSNAMGGLGSTREIAEFEQTAQPVELWHALLFILALALIAESVLANVYLAPRTAGGQD